MVKPVVQLLLAFTLHVICLFAYLFILVTVTQLSEFDLFVSLAVVSPVMQLEYL